MQEHRSRPLSPLRSILRGVVQPARGRQCMSEVRRRPAPKPLGAKRNFRNTLSLFVRRRDQTGRPRH
eukprot:3624739-Alexandrium_andersonii.AAC.1